MAPPMTAIDERLDERAPIPKTVLRSELVLDETPLTERRRAGDDRSWQTALARILVSIALLAAWAFTYLYVLSGLPEGRAQKALYAQLRTELAQGITPVEEPVAPGAPIALVDIPAAGVHNVVVVEGTTSTQLQDGPGHLRSSALPGQQGVSVLLGRALSYGAPFGGLRQLQPGATIRVTTGQGTFGYRVRDLRRRGDPLPPAVATGSARLTLVTADGSGALAALSPASTLYVDADITGTPQPRSGPTVATADDELPMGTDLSVPTLAELVLALQLFVLVLLAVVWASSRWPRVVVRAVAVPVVIATLWLVTELATRLLPNLM
jgi:sortase A